jgi:transcriptional/translational regulatory protein YebC/TACO1
MQEAYRTPNILDLKRNFSCHIVVETSNAQNKEMILKAVGRKVKSHVKVDLSELHHVMIVYLTQNPTRHLLQLKNNFSKVEGYKINSNKSVAFLYSKDKQAQKEIVEWHPSQ